MDKIKRFAKKNRFCYYIVYLLYRLYGLFFSFLCLFMRIFPIQANKIVCCNVKGKRYGDNPKYVADELLRQSSDYDIVWLLNKNVSTDLPKGCRRAGYNLFSLAYHHATAKIWIDSNTKPVGLLKRKGQYYIQTWHGSYGLKKIGSDILEKLTLIDKKDLSDNSKLEDLFVSNSRFYSELYQRAFWYAGEILECGSPRNDIFFTDSAAITKQVKNYFHVTSKHIVLYAPTYRSDYKTDSFKLDFERLKNCLECKFGGEWVILIRLHPQNMLEADGFLEYNDHIINATDYSVMQELLVTADILVSDYSSCMFDFVTTGKTCFIYASDVNKYKDDRDFYFDIYQLPFPVAENNEQMEQNILNFNQNKYEEKLQQLFKQVGLCENGTACKQVVRWIEQKTS